MLFTPHKAIMTWYSKKETDLLVLPSDLFLWREELKCTKTCLSAPQVVTS